MAGRKALKTNVLTIKRNVERKNANENATNAKIKQGRKTPPMAAHET